MSSRLAWFIWWLPCQADIKTLSSTSSLCLKKKKVELFLFRVSCLDLEYSSTILSYRVSPQLTVQRGGCNVRCKPHPWLIHWLSSQLIGRVGWERVTGDTSLSLSPPLSPFSFSSPPAPSPFSLWSLTPWLLSLHEVNLLVSFAPLPTMMVTTVKKDWSKMTTDCAL